MSRKMRRKLGNHTYVLGTDFAAGRIKKGTVTIADVFHDDWCDLLSGKGPCNCAPDVRYKTVDE